jgi:hypothetical protein
MSAKQKGLTCLKYADPPTTITGVAHRWGGGGGSGQTRAAMAKANADRATAKPGDHRPAHATQPRVQTHDGRPTGGNPVQSDPPPLIHGNKTKRNEHRAPTPPPVLGPPLSLYSPLPGGRSARADHEEEERERQGALALPCAPASPGLGSPRGPRLPCQSLRRLLALADPPARRAGGA